MKMCLTRYSRQGSLSLTRIAGPWAPGPPGPAVPPGPPVRQQEDDRRLTGPMAPDPSEVQVHAHGSIGPRAPRPAVQWPFRRSRWANRRSRTPWSLIPLWSVPPSCTKCEAEFEPPEEVVDVPCITGPWAQGPLVPPCNGPPVRVLQFVPDGQTAGSWAPWPLIPLW